MQMYTMKCRANEPTFSKNECKCAATNQITAVLQMTENELCIDEMLSTVETILNSAAQGALKERKIYSKAKLRKRNGLIEIALDLGKKLYVWEGKFVDLKQRMNNEWYFKQEKRN